MTVNSKQSDHKAPELRFPGFPDIWEEKRIKDIASFYSGGTPTSTNKGYYNGKIPFIRSGEILTNETEQFITEKAIKSSSAKMVDKGALLYALYGATSGCVAISQIKGAINQAILCIRTDEITDWLFNYLSYRKEKILAKYLQGGQGNLSANIIKNLRLYIPSLPEQQKIAGFLGAVDKWIENLRSQKASLESNKKGMMQKIFSQEIRFKDDKGYYFPEWEKKRLGDTGEIVTGTTPPTEDSEYYGGDLPWVTPTDINYEKDIFSTKIQLTKKGLSRARMVPKNSLLVTCIASIGKNVILRVDGSCNQQINAITPNKYNNVDFLYYLVEQNNNILLRYAGAGGMLMLNKKDFSRLKFNLPSLPEQHKIADFLTSTDNLINLEKQQITLAEKWRKGLMQGLFV